MCSVKFKEWIAVLATLLLPPLYHDTWKSMTKIYIYFFHERSLTCG
ncbi:unnamed protein product [Brassica rapa subsp. trilocularis]